MKLNLKLHPNRTTPALLCVTLLAIGLLGGCAADRPGLQSIEPTWSHRNSPTELSRIHETVWDRFAANQALAATGLSRVESQQRIQPARR